MNSVAPTAEGRPTIGAIGDIADAAGRDEPMEPRFRCPAHHCDQTLEIHQPDPEDPERLLGICPACRTWHYIELDPWTGRYELRGPVAGETAA